MSPSSWRISRLAPIGLLVALAAVAWSSRPASADGPDISGNFDVNIQHSTLGSSSCKAMLTVTGPDMEADLTCSTLGSGLLFGSYDKLSGQLDVSGSVGTHQMALHGSAADDFNISGSCTISPETGSCSFSGFRQILFVGGATELPGVASSGGSTAGRGWLIAAAGGALAAVVALTVPAHVRRRP